MEAFALRALVAVIYIVVNLAWDSMAPLPSNASIAMLLLGSVLVLPAASIGAAGLLAFNVAWTLKDSLGEVGRPLLQYVVTEAAAGAAKPMVQQDGSWTKILFLALILAGCFAVYRLRQILPSQNPPAKAFDPKKGRGYGPVRKGALCLCVAYLFVKAQFGSPEDRTASLPMVALIAGLLAPNPWLGLFAAALFVGSNPLVFQDLQRIFLEKPVFASTPDMVQTLAEVLRPSKPLLKGGRDL